MWQEGDTMVAMADNKRKAGRPPKHAPGADKRSGVPINLRIDPAVHAIIPKYRALFRNEHSVRLSMTDVVEKALIQLFRDAGLEVPEGN